MPQAYADAPGSEVPAAASEVRSAYLDQTVIGYLLYGVGAVTAFLAVALSLSDAEAALHSSLLAIGLLVAGVSGDGLERLLGPRAAHGLAYLLLAAGSVCLATAPAYAITLAGATMVGIGAGLLLARVNRTFTRGGGTLARLRMGRGALVAMVGSISVPIVIGIGDNSGLGWQLAFVVGGVLIVAGVWVSRGRCWIATETAAAIGRLPGRYWLAWWLIVLVVAVEFSIVFWASTLVERQTGVSLGDATLVAAAFYAGMATTRVGLSLPFMSRRDPVMLMRAGLVAVLFGSLLAWESPGVGLAALGIYLGGMGTGFQYPLGASVALALVPGLEDRASARLILASGLAILAAPFVLGLAADLSGVSVAWLLIPGLCLAAFLLSVPVGRSRSTATV